MLASWPEKSSGKKQSTINTITAVRDLLLMNIAIIIIVSLFIGNVSGTHKNRKGRKHQRFRANY